MFETVPAKKNQESRRSIRREVRWVCGLGGGGGGAGVVDVGGDGCLKMLAAC